MGTNSAPEIATLTLYWTEASYIDRLLLQNPEEALRHAHTWRYIDDLLTWDCLPPHKDIYGGLDWSETTRPDGSCTFLSALIRVHDGALRLGVFDKALEWTFKVIRYPSATSNAPGHQAAGVFTGQLTRFARLCNNTKDFKFAVTQLTLSMLRRGHSSSSLAKGWCSHAKGFRDRPRRSTLLLSQWFRRMGRWALYHFRDPLAGPAGPPAHPPAGFHAGPPAANPAGPAAHPAAGHVGSPVRPLSVSPARPPPSPDRRGITPPSTPTTPSSPTPTLPSSPARRSRTPSQAPPSRMPTRANPDQASFLCTRHKRYERQLS